MIKKQKYISDLAKIIENELQELYGSWVKQKDLGMIYSPKKTEFNVFASNIDNLKLQLYERKSGKDKFIEEKELVQLDKNFYTNEIKGDLKNKLYRFTVKRDGKEHIILDPYVKSVVENGDKGVILNPSDYNPKGWDEDQYQKLVNKVDAIIYETHIMDFTGHPSSGAKNRGKYLGFTEESYVPNTKITTGLSHLKELGVNYVQMMPIFENGSSIETDEKSYNWGYDPENHMVPEGSYSNDPRNPKQRIIELKKMIKTLHDNNIGIIKDTVLNHTYVLGRNSLYHLAKDEFFRSTNGSGCGNELASENLIVRKFMLDNLKYWQEEYHIDGFRFDLMALHDDETMSIIKEELEAKNKSTIIYGEPWKALESELDYNEKLHPMDRAHQINSGIGAFNDKARNAIKGSPNGYDRGYVTGNIYETRDSIKDIITAEIDIFKGEPDEVIAYTTCHDGNTLYEKICKSAQEYSNYDKKRAAMFANSIIMTSQAIPMIHSGAEMLRTRDWDENPYNKLENNLIDWNNKVIHKDVSDYYAGLIKLRKEHPAFRIGDSNKIRESIGFYDDINKDYGLEGIIAFELSYENDPWENIVVIHNPYHDNTEVKLPYKSNWKVVVEGNKSGTDPIKEVIGDTYQVKGLSTSILYT
ncbi:MAG: type I pullulanase [Candidatus Woesearchaeota archaeon]